MHPLTIRKNYCLRLPDGRPLGHVLIAWLDDSWAGGTFQPAQNFGDFRHLFEKEAELRNDQIIPLWEQAADAIEALHIQVVEEGKERSHLGMRVLLDGNEVSLGTPLSVERKV